MRLQSGRVGVYIIMLLVGLVAGIIGGGELMRWLYPRSGHEGLSGQTQVGPGVAGTNSEQAVSAGAGGQSSAAGGESPDIMVTRSNAIVRATRAVTPSVVGIVVTQIRVVQRSYYSSDFFDLFFGPQTVPKFKQVDNIGSGFVFRDNGLIMTNYHVVEGARKVYVNFSDGRQVEATIVGADAQSDIAVLQVDPKGITPVVLGNSDELMTGEWAIAIGNPFLNFINDAHPTVTVGVVSALNRNFSSAEGAYYRGMIQTDAAINPGNSGGPLLDALGRVIGINTVIYTGGGANKGWVGIGFAIPINRARRVVDELVKYGRRRQVWTGISAQELNRSVALALGYDRTEGVVVVGAVAGSPGARAGLGRGDIIVQIGTMRIQTSTDLEAAFVDYFVGDTAPVKFYRKGKEMTTSMKLEEYKPSQ